MRSVNLLAVPAAAVIAAILFAAGAAAQQHVAPEPPVEDIRFSHNITLHPIPLLPALVSFVPAEHSQVVQVRGHFVIDEELLIVPLRLQSATQAYRGIFPTPGKALWYRFQITLANGKSTMSEPFSVDPGCESRNYSAALAADHRTAAALELQKQEQQLKYLADTIDALSERR